MEKKDGTGALFKNDKGDNDKRPDYRGDINIDGTSYWIAAWLKDGAKGKYMSLAVTPKEGTVVARPAKDELDVPF